MVLMVRFSHGNNHQLNKLVLYPLYYLLSFMLARNRIPDSPPTEFCLLRPNVYRSVFGLAYEDTSHRFVDRSKVRAVCFSVISNQ